MSGAAPRSAAPRPHKHAGGGAGKQGSKAGGPAHLSSPPGATHSSGSPPRSHTPDSVRLVRAGRRPRGADSAARGTSSRGTQSGEPGGVVVGGMGVAVCGCGWVGWGVCLGATPSPGTQLGGAWEGAWEGGHLGVPERNHRRTWLPLVSPPGAGRYVPQPLRSDRPATDWGRGRRVAGAGSRAKWMAEVGGSGRDWWP